LRCHSWTLPLLRRDRTAGKTYSIAPAIVQSRRRHPYLKTTVQLHNPQEKRGCLMRQILVKCDQYKKNWNNRVLKTMPNAREHYEFFAR
jgi:hypothetical protein